MDELGWAWLGYIGACIVLPFLWGVVVHWIFSRLPDRPAPGRTAERTEESALAAWDYHI